MKNLVIACVVCLLSATARAADLPPEIVRIQTEWARINYKLPEKEQEGAFKTLAGQSRAVAEKLPGRAEALIWEGIVLAGYAKARGGFSALSLAE